MMKKEGNTSKMLVQAINTNRTCSRKPTAPKLKRKPFPQTRNAKQCTLLRGCEFIAYFLGIKTVNARSRMGMFQGHLDLLERNVDLAKPDHQIADWARNSFAAPTLFLENTERLFWLLIVLSHLLSRPPLSAAVKFLIPNR